MPSSDDLVPLLGSSSFIPSLHAYLRSDCTANLPLDSAIIQAILVCIVAGDKNLILHTPEEDVGLVVRLAFWVSLACSSAISNACLDINGARHAPPKPTDYREQLTTDILFRHYRRFLTSQLTDSRSNRDHRQRPDLCTRTLPPTLLPFYVLCFCNRVMNPSKSGPPLGIGL